MTVAARSLRVLASLLVLAPACSRAVNPPERSPTPTSPHTGTIAFVRGEATHGTDIWLINADGTGARQLTHGPDIEMRPAWSPDGTELAFVSVPVRPDQEIFHQLLEHDWNICVIKIDGADETCLTHGTSAAPEHQETPAWSPDGRKIAFACHVEDHPDICVMNADGSHVRSLTRGPAADVSPAWSSDGSRIFFLRIGSGFFQDRGNVFVMNADGSDPRQLTSGQDLADFAVSPDGTQLVVHDAAGHSVVLIKPYAGSPSATILDEDLGGQFLRLAWSPDGSAIALAVESWVDAQQQGGGATDLYVMNADGTDLTKITTGEDAADPAWRPGP